MAPYIQEVVARWQSDDRVITAVNSGNRRGIAYLLTAAQVLAQFDDVERATLLLQPVERFIFRGLPALGRLLGYRL